MPQRLACGWNALQQARIGTSRLAHGGHQVLTQGGTVWLLLTELHVALHGFDQLLAERLIKA